MFPGLCVKTTCCYIAGHLRTLRTHGNFEASIIDNDDGRPNYSPIAGVVTVSVGVRPGVAVDLKLEPVLGLVDALRA